MINEKKFLFICYGNVGRSQMAQAYTNYFAGKDIAISAGTIDVKAIIGNHPLRNVITIMQEDGIDISQQKVKKVTKKMIHSSDNVIVLCKKTDCPEYVLKANNLIFHEVADPYEQNLENTRKIRDNIKNFVFSLQNKF